MSRVTLIVLAWNQWPLTERCLESLLRCDLTMADVMVVDNGSTDETPLRLGEYCDRVRILRLPQNLGFVRGMNAGIGIADPNSDIVLLNNDLVFNQSDWLCRMRDAAYAAPKIGIVGCRNSDGAGHILHNGSFIVPDTLWGQQTETGTVERDFGQYAGHRSVQGIAFAVAYIRRELIETIGLLNECYHSYFEDTDYCLTAAAYGYSTVVCGAATVVHAQHGSTQSDSQQRNNLFESSRAVFRERWGQALAASYRADVLWQSTAQVPSDYAQLSSGLVRRMEGRGLRMFYESAYGAASSRPAPELAPNSDYRWALAAGRGQPLRAAAAIVCAEGEAFDRARGRLRIGYCVSETRHPIASWVRKANRLDELWLPSAAQVEAFRAAGVRVAMHVVPFGVDTDYLHPNIGPAARSSNDFVFLAVVDWSDLAAPELLIQTFQRAFNAREPVELMLYVRPTEAATEPEAAIAKLRWNSLGGRVRVVLHRGFPSYQRGLLYRSADALLAARRGYGWDRSVMEAMACGLPVVAGDWQVAAPWVQRYGYPYALRAPGAGENAEFAQPDPDALALQMRRVYEQRDEARRRGLQGAVAIAAEANLDRCADRVVARLDELGALAPKARTSAPSLCPARSYPITRGQIVVLGMHRSGTSALCGLLHLMGAYCGPPERLLQNAEDNPKGFWERGDVHDACRLTLAARGADWHLPGALAATNQNMQRDAFRRDFAPIIAELDMQRPWFIKEPRLCLLVQDLLPLLERPVFIHVARNPLEVAMSLARRNQLPLQHGLALWEHYTCAAFAASRGYPRLLVDYAELLRDPAALVERLLRELGALGVSGLQQPEAQEISAWVEPDLHRNRSEDDPTQALSASQLALHRAIADRSILDDAAPRTTASGSLALLAPALAA